MYIQRAAGEWLDCICMGKVQVISPEMLRLRVLHESRIKASGLLLLRTVAEYDHVDRRLVSGGVLPVHESSVDTFVQNWHFFSDVIRI